MSFKNKFFIIRKSLFREKTRSIVGLILMTIILLCVLLALEILHFFSEINDSINKNFIDARCCVLSMDSDVSTDDVVSLYENKDFVDMIIDGLSYTTSVTYKTDDVNYALNLQACVEGCVPDVTNGEDLDFNKKNQVLLPETMILSGNNNTTKKIDTASLIGKKIVCSFYSMDYTTIVDDTNKEIVFGGTPNGEVIIELTVVGTYDNNHYFQQPHTAFISALTANEMHMSDIKDKTGYTQSSIMIVTDSVKSINKVHDIASNNNIFCSNKVSFDSKSYIMMRVFTCIFIFILILICIWIANISVKMDLKKNVCDYVMLVAYGYTDNNVMSILIIKYLAMYLGSVILSIFISLPVSSLVSQYLHNIDGNIYNIRISFFAVVCLIAICVIITLFTILNLSMTLFKFTVKDLSRIQ
ncbi:MAG: hypothetical protein J6A58_07455 [Oscillospiraceae bacterium]|nr:hypothetical protein [Oscillospiraceae bacterium]